MFADDFPEATPDTIARNRGANRRRGNKAGPKTRSIIGFKNAEQDEAAVLDAAVLLDLFKFGGTR